jgi:hypothetical protein
MEKRIRIKKDVFKNIDLEFDKMIKELEKKYPGEE